MKSLVLAACGLVLAAFLSLLAVDVLSWQHRLAAGDARFAAVPGPSDLWQPHEIVPGGLARRLLGIDDDLAYRKGVRLFRLGRPEEPALGQLDLPADRAQAEGILDHLNGQVKNRALRARITNLLGILALAAASDESTQTAALLRQTIVDFRSAVRLDPGNHEAATNLELVLRLRSQKGRREASQNRTTGTAKKVGLGGSGSGY
jgi:hypothetical protein